MPNLVSFTCPSLQILEKTQARFPNSGFLFQSLLKKICHDSRTSNDIDMKLGPITKLYKRNMEASKKFEDDIMSKNCDVLSFFWFMGNLEQPGSRISDARSVKLTFSLKATFYLTKTENKTKTSLPQLP